MGCDAHVVVVDADPAARRDAQAYARTHLEALEGRWSRFRPTSEISLLNEKRGVPVVVSRDTFDLIERAVHACDLTRGHYDPTVLDTMLALGYNRTFNDLAAAPKRSHFGVVAPGCGGIALNRTLRSVTLAPDVGFDPGGIGKGFAADLVVEALRARGIAGAMVNLGGDVAVDGQAPDANGWIIGIEDPSDPQRIVARVTMESGGVCTSSRTRRTWIGADGNGLHHLVDPHTGRPVAGNLESVTVVAGAAWFAEITAKAFFVGAASTEQHWVPATDMAFADVHTCAIDANNEFVFTGDRGVFDCDSDTRLRVRV